MQEVEDQCTVDVAFGACNQCYVIVRGVNEADSRHLNDRSFFSCFCCHDFVCEVHDFIATKGGNEDVINFRASISSD